MNGADPYGTMVGGVAIGVLLTAGLVWAFAPKATRYLVERGLRKERLPEQVVNITGALVERVTRDATSW
jgi:hypothetical protein